MKRHTQLMIASIFLVGSLTWRIAIVAGFLQERHRERAERNLARVPGEEDIPASRNWTARVSR